MVKNNKCVAKARTALARRTLDPLYQQQLIFHEDPKEAILRVIFHSFLIVSAYFTLFFVSSFLSTLSLSLSPSCTLNLISVPFL